MIELFPAELGPYIKVSGANLAVWVEPNGLKFLSDRLVSIYVPLEHLGIYQVEIL